MDKDKFYDFKENVFSFTADILKDEANCTLVDIRKNNGLILTGINITPRDSKIGTIVYIDGFEAEYENGSSYEEIAFKICSVYRDNKDKICFDTKIFENFEAAATNIVYKLINYNANKDFLDNVPHRRILDLAVVYYYLADISGDALASAVVRNEIMHMWDTDESTLYKIAKGNTPKLLPSKIQSMQEVLNGVIPFEHGVGDKSLDIMYVLTNKSGINGAACMLYPNVISDFANAIQEDLYILPSSIHEIIIVPKTMISDLSDVRELVSFINETEVRTEEVLSDTVYYFDRTSGMIEVA